MIDEEYESPIERGIEETLFLGLVKRRVKNLRRIVDEGVSIALFCKLKVL